MNSINTEIRKRIDNRNNLFWTASADGGAVIGATSEIIQHFESQSYNKWLSPFNERVQDLQDSQNYSTDDIRYARQLAASRRWEWEQFFAQKENNAPNDIFSVTNDNGELVRMTDEQIKILQNGGKIQGLQVHHINSVHSNSIEMASDPENTKLATLHGHLKLHKGNFSNQTSGEAKEITKMTERTKEHNENIRETEGYIISGLIFGSIGAFIKWRQMSKDPRPWKKKSAIIAGTFALSGIQGAGIAIAAHLTSELIQDSIADFATEYSAEFGAKASSEVFSDLIGAAGGIEAAIVLRLGVKIVSELVKGNSFKESAPDIGRALAQATAEQIAFFLLGLALDNLTPIPDPTLATVVTALRITYSLGKLGYNYNVNRKNAVECARKRMDTLYDIAAISFA